MGRVFLIADTHFGGESIIRYENRPFKTVEEMERCLIEKWNSVVSEEDTVYVLGDFSTNQDAEADRRVLSQLKGEKILVMGNHDRHRTPQEWRDLGFTEISPWPIVYQEFFLFSHEPMYISTNMPYANFYGHVHGNVTYNSLTKQSACVSVERIEYTPIEFEELVKKVKEI